MRALTSLLAKITAPPTFLWKYCIRAKLEIMCLHVLKLLSHILHLKQQTNPEVSFLPLREKEIRNLSFSVRDPPDIHPIIILCKHKAASAAWRSVWYSYFWRNYTVFDQQKYSFLASLLYSTGKPAFWFEAPVTRFKQNPDNYSIFVLTRCPVSYCAGWRSELCLESLLKPIPFYCALWV